MGFPFDKVVSTLQRYYKGDVPSVTKVANKKRDPYLVLVGCILSLRTKDEVTDKAAERLFRRARNPREILTLPVTELERLIYPVGFYRTKARTIQEISKTILEKYNGEVPETMDELLSFKGVGRKTANIVITEGFNKAGIAVDTHVHRISNRLGAVKTRNPYETEDALRNVLPRKYWKIYNMLLVTHGKRTCTPLSPFCSRCPIYAFCKRVGVTRSR
ncbi:MAG TPA: endonuclease III [Syntrophorhabdales bacterium]|nr:endonuclease III [Syntrophorhabdales bacterium]